MLRTPITLLASTFAAGMAAGLVLTLIVSSLSQPVAALPDPAIIARFASPTDAGITGTYRAEVLRVIDGDTIEARVQVWLGHELVTRIRLKDVDAPEITGACPQEREKAAKARKTLAGLVQGRRVVLADVRPDKYFGRVIARVVADGDIDVGQALLSEGLARPYRGGRRGIWCDLARS